MLITECIACQHGFHDSHQEIIEAAPGGLLGGAMCPCRGECRDRPRADPAIVSADPEWGDSIETWTDLLAPSPVEPLDREQSNGD